MTNYLTDGEVVYDIVALLRLHGCTYDESQSLTERAHRTYAHRLHGCAYVHGCTYDENRAADDAETTLRSLCPDSFAGVCTDGVGWYQR